MKVTRFEVPIFIYKVIVVTIEGPDDVADILPLLKELKVNKADTKEVKRNIKESVKKGGIHFYNEGLQSSMIIIYSDENYEDYINTLGHEKRHIEDAILETKGIRDRETAAYIAGYLTQKLFLKNE